MPKILLSVFLLLNLASCASSKRVEDKGPEAKATVLEPEADIVNIRLGYMFVCPAIMTIKFEDQDWSHIKLVRKRIFKCADITVRPDDGNFNAGYDPVNFQNGEIDVTYAVFHDPCSYTLDGNSAKGSKLRYEALLVKKDKKLRMTETERSQCASEDSILKIEEFEKLLKTFTFLK